MTCCNVGRDQHDPDHRVCISCQQQEVPCPFGGVVPVVAAAPPIEEKAPKAKEPNKTEAAYRRHLELEYPGARILYEPITIHLANGHRYTPDWLVILATGEFIFVEVKGSYRMHSHQRARLAFDQARIEYPMWRWRWAEKEAGGTWSVQRY